MAPSSGRWRNRAALDAALKFGPQRTALHEAAEEAQNNYRQTVRSGNSAAQQTRLAAANAQPQVEHAYAGAGAAQSAGATLVSKALAGLPGVADQFKGDQASEVQQQIANLAAARARDLGLLQQQGVAAQAGAQFNQQNARSSLAQALGQLVRKSQSLAGEQGDFTAAESDKLQAEAEKLAQSERQSTRTASTSRANSKEGNAQQERASERSAATSRANSREHGKGGSATVNGVKILTGGEHAKARGLIAAQQGLAGKLFAHGLERQQVRQELERGAKPKNAPQIPRYAADELMAAALDNAQFGHITRGTLGRLHAAGYSVKELGLTVAPVPSIGGTIRSAAQGVKKLF